MQIALEALQECCDIAEQLQSISENLRYYFNMEAFARDMEMSDVFTIHHGSEVPVLKQVHQQLRSQGKHHQVALHRYREKVAHPHQHHTQKPPGLTPHLGQF